MQELIERLQRKDELALTAVMRLYKNKIYCYLCMLLGDSELAEDLTQDTFVKVYFKAHTLRTENLKAWIYAIATNLARSEFRKKALKKWLPLTQVPPGAVAYNPLHDERLIAEQMIAALPPKYRIPLLMKELDNFSFEEIALMMKKPVGTIKSLVFRAKGSLQGMALAEKGEQDGISQ